MRTCERGEIFQGDAVLVNKGTEGDGLPAVGIDDELDGINQCWCERWVDRVIRRRFVIVQLECSL